MYEDRYDLNETEGALVQAILADMTAHGGRLVDRHGRPVYHRIVDGKRFLICDKGLIWRFRPSGSPLDPAGPRTGACRRNAAIEMWTGRWTRQESDGPVRCVKCLVWVPLDEHINGRSGISKIAWYRSEKGFAHPLEGPDQAPADVIARLEARHRARVEISRQRMEQEGLRPAGPPAAADKATAPTETAKATTEPAEPAGAAEAPETAAAQLPAQRSGRPRKGVQPEQFRKHNEARRKARDA